MSSPPSATQLTAGSRQSFNAERNSATELEEKHSPVRAVCVTPSHQYPTGVGLSPMRRGALLNWSNTTSGWIIEDDYDSEYHYDGQPIASVQGAEDAERVIYLGTFNKGLFPGLRVAYLVLPKPLVKTFGLLGFAALRHEVTAQAMATLAQAIAADRE